MRRSTCICKVCNKSFEIFNCWLKRKNGGSFCSKKCSYIGKEKRKPTLIDRVCAHCDKPFRIRINHGGTGETCSNKCRWAHHGTKCGGDKHPNWKGGIAERTHRSRAAIREAKKLQPFCSKCGNTDKLQGHHKDKHSNFPLFRELVGNIEVVCAKCHGEEHPQLANFIDSDRPKSGVYLKCKQCNKEYYRPKSSAGTSLYCSYPCKYEYQKGKNPLWLKRSGYPQQSVGLEH